MKVSERVDLPVPAEEAWRRLVAWEDQSRWMKDAGSVRALTAQREGVGVIVAVPTLVLNLPLFTDRLEVTVWDPPRRLVMAHRRLVRGVGSWTLETEGDDTVFTWSEDVSLPVPILGGLALLVYRPVMRRLMRRSMASLRALLLAGGRPNPRP